MVRNKGGIYTPNKLASNDKVLTAMFTV